MGSRVTVSVILPLYNKEVVIRRALDSIANQTFADFELIIVDDGCTDESAHIATRYHDARFRVIKQSNAGPGAARNRGVAESTGSLLAFLDADDEWLPTYLENSVAFLDSIGGSAVSVSAGYFEYPAGTSTEGMWRARGISDGIFRLSTQTPTMEAVYKLAYMSPCSTIVRTKTFRQWGGFYSRDRCMYAEDAYLWLKILLNEPVAFFLDPLVRVHREASELSNNLRCSRPVEPFLVDPSDIESSCPENLRFLLARILATRAFKTACVLGYWGRWREARSLMDRFALPKSWALGYYLPAMLCSTSAGSILARLWRLFRKQ